GGIGSRRKRGRAEISALAASRPQRQIAAASQGFDHDERRRKIVLKIVGKRRRDCAIGFHRAAEPDLLRPGEPQRKRAEKGAYVENTRAGRQLLGDKADLVPCPFAVAREKAADQIRATVGNP